MDSRAPFQQDAGQVDVVKPPIVAEHRGCVNRTHQHESEHLAAEREIGQAVRRVMNINNLNPAHLNEPEKLGQSNWKSNQKQRQINQWVPLTKRKLESEVECGRNDITFAGTDKNRAASIKHLNVVGA